MKKICTFTLCLFAFALAGCNAPSFTTKTFSEMYLGAPVSVVMDTHDKSRAEYNKLYFRNLTTCSIHKTAIPTFINSTL